MSLCNRCNSFNYLSAAQRGFGQGKRINRSAAMLLQQYRSQRQRPSRIDYVINQQDRDWRKHGTGTQLGCQLTNPPVESIGPTARGFADGRSTNGGFFNLERLQHVTQLHGAVLHFFLRACLASFPKGGDEKQP